MTGRRWAKEEDIPKFRNLAFYQRVWAKYELPKNNFTGLASWHGGQGKNYNPEFIGEENWSW